jgi:hypothetical protein
VHVDATELVDAAIGDPDPDSDEEPSGEPGTSVSLLTAELIR